MAQLRCPRCATIIALDPDRSPVCPNCGFSGPAPEATSAPAPATWAAMDARASTGSGTSAGSRTSSVIGASASARQTDSGAVAALILGIVGLVAIPLIPSIIAWVMGSQAVRRCREDPSLEGLGMAQAGMIMGIIGTILIGLFVLFFIFFFAALASAF